MLAAKSNKFKYKIEVDIALELKIDVRYHALPTLKSKEQAVSRVSKPPVMEKNCVAKHRHSDTLFFRFASILKVKAILLLFWNYYHLLCGVISSTLINDLVAVKSLYGIWCAN